MNYNILTDAQKRVFHSAKERLETKPWFRGVCLDEFPDHDECINDPHGAIASVEMATAYWDAPNGIFGQ